MPGAIQIRTLRPEDLGPRLVFFEPDKQSYMKRHLSNIISYNPEGCFVAAEGRTFVGMVTTTIYEGCGWIGWLFVLPYRRGEGIGSTLVNTALEQLWLQGAETTVLEAVDKAIPLYARLGFHREGATSHYSGTVKVEPTSPNVRGVQHDGLRRLADFDERYFGASRARMFETLVDQEEESLVSVEGENGIDGYIGFRAEGNRISVGPMVVPGNEMTVVSKLLSMAQREDAASPLYLRMPDANRKGAGQLRELGLFMTGYRTTRMRLGEKLYAGDLSVQYSLGGPGKG